MAVTLESLRKSVGKKNASSMVFAWLADLERVAAVRALRDSLGPVLKVHLIVVVLRARVTDLDHARFGAGSEQNAHSQNGERQTEETVLSHCNDLPDDILFLLAEHTGQFSNNIPF